MTTDYLFRISPETEWQQAQAAGGLLGGDLDKDSGFVHLSTAAQVQGTLDLFFAAREDLFLLKIETAQLGDGVRWESAPGTPQLFPHFYGADGGHAPIPLGAIIDATKIPLENGKHVVLL